MPVAPTYPGVYIEELPSGVHTITGVSTSIAAFVGFTAKGAVDEAVHIFSFADFERDFGGLAVDSPLSYCVKHFFQNGGTDAYVVRVAQGAAAASVTLKNAAGPVLIVTAVSPGRWGNGLQIEVDYDTVNPSSQFNLRVVEFVERNGELVPGPTEVYRNLTMNSADPNFVVETINAGSQLIQVALPPGLAVTGAATSESGPLRDADLALLDLQHNKLAFTLNGQGPYEITLNAPALVVPLTLAQFQTALLNLGADIAKKINDRVGGAPVSGARAGAAILITAAINADRASIRFLNAGSYNACSILKLGVANGGIEIDGASTFRPTSTGTTGIPALPASVSGPNPGAVTNALNKLGVSLNGGPPFEVTLDVVTAVNTPEEIAAKINAAVGDTLVVGSIVGNTISIASADWAKCWSIRIMRAAANSAAATLKLGANLGTETVPSASAGSALLDTDVQKFYATPLAQLQQLHMNVSLNGQEPFDVDLSTLAPAPALPWNAGDAGTARQNIATAIADSINANLGLAPLTPAVTPVVNALGIISSDPARWSAIHITSAAQNDAAAPLRLGLANGGVEDSLTIDVRSGASTTSLHTVRIPLWAYWATPKATPQPRSLDDVVADIDQALKNLGNTDPYLAGASAQRIGDTIRVLPGYSMPNDPNTVFDISGASAATLGFTAASRNVARYAPGVGLAAFSQTAGASGNDGTAPSASELTGNQLAKTGLYALEDVDIFNLLVMPDATAAGGMMGVLTEAIAYCVRRRAFMIIDAPEQISTFARAQAWIGGPASPLRSRNDALYFPRLREPDPMMNGSVRPFPAAGAMAGIYARTDAERGVWKAPAGTMATVWGATGLSYTMNDAENGVFNQRGLNCLRTFPVIGTVSWGARTGNGADALADEYKYVPVRRLALFLEESLYRGSQWAVFEPNDEPLWAQLRLNIGAFMHTLFTQGAFQGQTPRDAYFVKCDKETTTQNDVNLGRVNIVVGFAPLKPAEFVVIQIQQIAGAIRT